MKANETGVAGLVVFGLALIVVFSVMAYSMYRVVFPLGNVTQGEEIGMIQPNGLNTERDYANSQTNLNNSQANNFNAQAQEHLANAEKIKAETNEVKSPGVIDYLGMYCIGGIVLLLFIVAIAGRIRG